MNNTSTITIAMNLSEIAALRLQSKDFSMYTKVGDNAVRRSLKKHMRRGVQMSAKKASAPWLIALAFFEAVRADVAPKHGEVMDTAVRNSIQSFVESLLEGRFESVESQVAA